VNDCVYRVQAELTTMRNELACKVVEVEFKD
jgi:hypothetical protein